MTEPTTENPVNEDDDQVVAEDPGNEGDDQVVAEGTEVEPVEEGDLKDVPEEGGEAV